MTPEAVKAWRRDEREHLLAWRTGTPPMMRRRWGEAIEAKLVSVLHERAVKTLGVYWPIQGEFDPRPLIDRLVAAGVATALPAIVVKKQPLEYRAWRPGEKLVDGIWNIPTPEKRDVVIPEAVLVPLLGFDIAFYRLGYGGGYFDRTLAVLDPRPLAIGVGFEQGRIETIHPQPHDIPMDLIVTDAGLRQRDPERQ